MKYTPLFIIGFILCLSACTDNQLLPSSSDDGEKPVVKEERNYTPRMLWASINGRADATNDKNKIHNKEEFYKLKYCSTVVYMVPRA